MTNRFAEAIRVVVETAGDRGFRVALIGGFALPFLGVMRATDDVDFLVDSGGSEPLHEALTAAGQKCLHRTPDVANYESSRPAEIASIDLLFAHRARALAMLDRAQTRPLAKTSLQVPVVDAEALIGLKVQGIATNPERALQDRADILQLMKHHVSTLDRDLLRDYYSLFGMEAELDELLRDLDARRTR